MSAILVHTLLGGTVLMAAFQCSKCSPSTDSRPVPSSSAEAAAPQVMRTANRLSENEGKAVVLDGLAVDVAGRAGIHLDRADSIVPVAGRSRWDPDLLHQPVRGRGVLTRHAPESDPVTGIYSLELTQASIERLPMPGDGRIRTAPALRAADGSQVDVEGMAYKSSNGPILVLYGGIAYVRGLPMWDAATVRRTVLVRGTVRHPPLPPDAPPAGGSWTIEASSFELVR